MTVEYNYDHGNLLEDRHSYQYSKFQGLDFLKAWRKNRDAARNELGLPTPPPSPTEVYKPLAKPLKTAQRLEEVMAGLIQGELEELKPELAIWVKKFEGSKRLFDEYDNTFKPLTINGFHNLDAYLRYAEIMELVYTINSDLPCLNVLLKVLDTLIALKNELSLNNQARLAWLIARESAHIESIASINGLKA